MNSIKKRKAEIEATNAELGRNIHKRLQTRIAQRTTIIGSSATSTTSILPLPPQSLQLLEPLKHELPTPEAPQSGSLPRTQTQVNLFSTNV